MKMIAAVGIHGGVKKFRMSMQDLTNEKQMQSISKIKKVNKTLRRWLWVSLKILELNHKVG